MDVREASSGIFVFFFSSRRRHTRFDCDWSSDVCSSDLDAEETRRAQPFLEKLERFLREHVDSDRIDREGEIPEAVIQGLRDLGAFGIKIPREYGGVGLDRRRTQLHYTYHPKPIAACSLVY